jgi:hypothetical protein
MAGTVLFAKVSFGFHDGTTGQLATEVGEQVLSQEIAG